MKTNGIKTVWAVFCISSLLAAGASRVNADASPTAAQAGKTTRGTIASVDAGDKTVKVKGLFFSRTYHLGDNCQIALGDRKDASAADLRPGQKVTLTYTDAGGVLVANRIALEELRFRGTVRSFDQENRLLTVRDLASSKTFKVPQNCRILIRDGKEGSLDDVKIGHKVSVIYESPADELVARGIEQMSLTHSGSLSAIDTTDRSLKTTQMLGNKRFNLADNCTIIVDGKPGAELKDLRLGDRCLLSYEAVNGVNVVTRIERQAEPARTETATSRR
jgi:Cu/Ag efflux protein CusF